MCSVRRTLAESMPLNSYIQYGSHIEPGAVLVVGFAAASPDDAVAGAVVEAVPLEQCRAAQAPLRTQSLYYSAIYEWKKLDFSRRK